MQKSFKRKTILAQQRQSLFFRFKQYIQKAPESFNKGYTIAKKSKHNLPFHRCCHTVYASVRNEFMDSLLTNFEKSFKEEVKLTKILLDELCVCLHLFSLRWPNDRFVGRFVQIQLNLNYCWICICVPNSIYGTY